MEKRLSFKLFDYISRTDQEMKLEFFLSDVRLQIESAFYRKLNGDQAYNATIGFLQTTTFDTSGRITYMPIVSKDSTIVESLEGLKPRTTSFTKFIRYLSQVFNNGSKLMEKLQSVQDLFIQHCTELRALEDDSVWKFEIVEGADIVDAYRHGPRSCMQGKVGQLRMYVDNPDKVKLVKIYKEGKYVGRALLWNSDTHGMILDRVYPSNGVESFATKAWARRNGYHTKDRDSVGVSSGIPNDVEITLKHPKNGRIPYLDSFMCLKSMDLDHLVLTNALKSKNEEDGLMYHHITVGDYEGYERRIYDRTTYLTNGNFVPKKLVWTKRTYKYNGGNNKEHYVGSFENRMAEYRMMKGRTVVPVVLRPTDRMVKVLGNALIEPLDKWVVIDNVYYRRSDVRKVRNQDTYTPKADAVPHACTGSAEGLIILIPIGGPNVTA